ncbi:hypothetical protein [Actinoplanes friuliensis]|jgi:hypothetical protein|uniref:Uncharacterized protein n=1 Tax=Actinoplanes friuliensis DSM 7358 TaxID=1246995 RepID=U5W0C7_9ACTN|nr:hypothetical protein [Actinoplanes friuliensis]AGZ42544.1 hypothetical protein AFR_21370 [Actinoplanes friuliensis DSM 7358]
MSDEHGWPDFHDPGGHDDAGDHHDLESQHEAPIADDSPFHDDLFGHDDDPGVHDTAGEADAGVHEDAGWDDLHEPGSGHDDEAVQHSFDGAADDHGLGPVGADPDATPEAEVVSLFPPVVDVGPLPEPVDGFPWIDTGSLGLYHSGLVDPAAAAPVPAEDLAAYAGEDLPPGEDPWAALADSDDPATSTLAKWWSQDS